MDPRLIWMFSDYPRNLGDLQLHEQRGGHTLSRHVGTTPQQDVERLMKNPSIRAAGSFLNRNVAQRAVEFAIQHPDNVVLLNEWMRSGRSQLTLNAVTDKIIGSVLTQAALRRGITQPAPAIGVRVILRRDPKMRCGFRIHTAYPVIATDGKIILPGQNFRRRYPIAARFDLGIELPGRAFILRPD